MKTIVVDLALCLGCKTCELQCAIQRVSTSKDLHGAVRETPRPVPRVSVQAKGDLVIPVQCRQCEDAPCLAACPSGAIYREETAGKIVLNQQKCVGCWMCVMVCPFGAVTPYLEANKADKCDQCVFMDYPVCVDSCPTGALRFVETGEELKEIQIKNRERNLARYIKQGDTREGENIRGGMDNE